MRFVSGNPSGRAVRAACLPGRGAFTLVELLLVVAILGILCALAVPTVSPMLSGGRLRMTAREFASAGRYARTMALLNQTPVDLVLDGENHTFSVEARESVSDTAVSIGYLSSLTNSAGSPIPQDAVQSSLSGGFGVAMSKNERESMESLSGRDSPTNFVPRFFDASGAVMSDKASFADSVNIKRQTDGVTVRFDGYTDSISTRSAWERVSVDEADEDLFSTVRIRYHSNGTVRPYRVTVEADDGSGSLCVLVNRVGSPKIVPPEDVE